MSGLTPRQRRLTYTIKEAATLLGISPTHAYALVARGEFPCRVVKLGRRWVVPRTDLAALLGVPIEALESGNNDSEAEDSR